jgi:hypothetical protein
VNPRRQYVLNVLAALRIPAAGNMGVRQLVDEGNLGPAGENGVRVHLIGGDPAILLPAPRDDFQPVGKPGNLGTAVGFQQSPMTISIPSFLNRRPSSKI